MNNAECGLRNAEYDTRGAECKKNVPHSALHTPHSKGFTLFEVMVAVSILALVLVSLLGLKNRSSQDVMRSERITMATLLAKRVMTETLLLPLTPKEETGVFPEEDFKEYTWKKTILPTQIEKLLEVRVDVLWKEGVREEMVELVSYE